MQFIHTVRLLTRWYICFSFCRFDVVCFIHELIVGIQGCHAWTITGGGMQLVHVDIVGAYLWNIYQAGMLMNF